VQYGLLMGRSQSKTPYNTTAYCDKWKKLGSLNTSHVNGDYTFKTAKMVKVILLKQHFAIMSQVILHSPFLLF